MYLNFFRKKLNFSTSELLWDELAEKFQVAQISEEIKQEANNKTLILIKKIIKKLNKLFQFFFY